MLEEPKKCKAYERVAQSIAKIKIFFLLYLHISPVNQGAFYVNSALKRYVKFFEDLQLFPSFQRSLE